MTGALVYCRISADIAGTELGVTRQREDCEKLCAARGWPILDIFTDNDYSASTGVHRPGYAALLAAVERGQGNVIVTYQLSRLWRSRRERAIAIELLKTRRVAIACVKGQDIDLATAYGRAMVGLLGEFDTMESEVKSERMRSKIEQSARAGKQVAGGHRPYGYALTYKVVSQPGERVRQRITQVRLDDTEAAVVRECASRALAGESLYSICHDLNARGVVTSAGGQWQTTTLRRMLCSARISGRRQYIAEGTYRGARPLIGEIVCDESEWPGIISPADSDRLRMVLTRPERATVKAPRKLLSGILHCGRCERPMVCRPRAGVPRYACNPDPGHGACGRMFIDAARADDHVCQLVLIALDSPAMVERLQQRETSEPDLHARIRADEDDLEALAADMGNREITRSEWRAAREPIVARLAVARAQLAKSTETTALTGFVGSMEDMQTRWDAANISQRRAVITAVLDKVIVRPAVIRTRWDPERLYPVWRA